jgi:3-hydroxyacyl-[acyl-carrier-protein] dehydratase
MRFNLVDRIIEVQPGKALRAVKNLTLGEEYLADHFPTFPVMPGVLMLETLVEAGAWLLRLTDDFADSIIVLREVRGVKYGTFLEPGRQLELAVELNERDNGLASFKGKGEMEGQSVVTARLTLAHYSLRSRDPALAATDDRLVRHFRELAGLLQQPLRTRDLGKVDQTSQA